MCKFCVVMIHCVSLFYVRVLCGHVIKCDMYYVRVPYDHVVQWDSHGGLCGHVIQCDSHVL